MLTTNNVNNISNNKEPNNRLIDFCTYNLCVEKNIPYCHRVLSAGNDSFSQQEEKKNVKLSNDSTI